MSLSYAALDSPQVGDKPAEHLLILGNKGDLIAHAGKAATYIHKVLGVSVEPGQETSINGLLASVAEKLSPTNDTPSSLDSHVQVGGSLVRVTLASLPTYVPSRHTAPAKPHAATDIARGHASGDKPLRILLLLSSAEHAVALGTAVARAFPLYSRKSGPAKPPRKVEVVFGMYLAELGGEAVLKKVSALAEGIQLACRLVDAPCSELHTDAFVEEAGAVQSRLGAHRVRLTVIRGEELREKGFGGIYGVGKAADHPPALVVLSYNEGSQGPGVAWVGKGIVYDTGGLSIKTKTGMPGMKRDMGGAAAVLAAFEAAVSLNYKKGPLHALLCLAENAVDSRSARPDDIHTLYSGKTVEINNTDAEGRLVLGDGVAYASKHLGVKYVVNMATLTGAQGIATGKRHAAVYTNDEALETTAIAVGRSSGDLVHPLVYAPEFFQIEFKSAVADMKNSVMDRANAQPSCAGQFIGSHLGDWLKSNSWLHIDMAGPAYVGERATGWGVNFLVELVEKLG